MAALLFALGVWGVQQLSVLPASTFAFVALLTGLPLFWFARDRRLLAWSGALLCGFGWALAMAHMRLADALPADQEGRDVLVTGSVADLPQHFERGLRFTFEVESAAGPVPAKIALAWYRKFPASAEEEGDEASDDEPNAAMTGLPAPRAGEHWRLLVRLKQPHGSVNPHGFDYEGWLFERGIRANGYVRASPQNARMERRADGLMAAVGRLREAARQRIMRRERPDDAVLAALAVGDQQAVSPERWRLFAATGITHLMSISGLHVTMLGGLVAWLVNWLWRRSTRLPLIWPAQKAAAVAGFLGAFCYALLAGFGVPAQRTLYMLGIVVLALLSGRALRVTQVLGLALVGVLLADPWAVLAAGFWLSFGAVALLFYVGSVGHWWRDWLRAQWAMTLGLLPLLLALFQQFSLVSPLANALAIPLVSFGITPLALLGCLPGFAWALDLAHALLVPLLDFLQWLAAQPYAIWQQHAPPQWAVPLALCGVFWLLLPRGFPARWLGAVLLLPLFLIPPSRPSSGELVVTVLDVGQGEAVHVQTATHDLMFDTGPDFGGNADAGNRILVPYLRAVGVARLDRLIVSHSDRDHAGGADSLVAAVPVAVDERHCVDGADWQWDGVRFRVLHPLADDYKSRRPSNALSCVLLIESAHGRVLIPGDVEGRGESELLARHADAVQADILVAPHHGGRHTASPEFIAAVGAHDVVFPVGYRNRFGHPAETVLARFSTSGARLHRTDRDGAVSIKLDDDGLTLRHEREVGLRYWQNTALLAR